MGAVEVVVLIVVVAELVEHVDVTSWSVEVKRE